MNLIKVNLACGDVFIEPAEWINVDFAPASPAVRKANLLDRLPVPDSSASVVYASHFFEHIPRESIVGFLQECFRILAPGGTVQLVMTDFEEIASTYLRHRTSDQHKKADFLIVEIIDQAERRRPGSELGDIYREMCSRTSESDAEMRRFIHGLNGEAFGGVIIDSQFPGSSISVRSRMIAHLLNE